MKQKKVWLMSGPPGAGKSHWLKTHCFNSVIVSRDEIRFAMLTDEEDYFAHEDEVLKQFYNNIQTAIDDENGPDNIFVDATHLSRRSRIETLKALNLTQVEEINILCFQVPFSICLERNSKRVGRALVPKEVVQKMWSSQTLPSYAERFNHIYIIDKEGEVKNAQKTSNLDYF